MTRISVVRVACRFPKDSTMKKKKRISTAGEASSLNANPFSALQGEGLPSAPATPVTQPKVEKKVKKRGRLDVRREKSGRGGKTVTVISGEGFMGVARRELDKLLKSLKGRCGCGGAIKGQTVEIQGDQREVVAEELEKLGYRVVFTGG